MTNKFIDLSGKIDPWVNEALLAFDQCAAAQNLSYFLVGAAARDLLLAASGLRPYRKTEDVDLAIQVASWNEFHTVIQALILKQDFKETNLKHRFSFHDHHIDIIPFGGVSDQELKIHWPSEVGLIMSVAGFDEAYASSLVFKISENPVFTIRIVSFPGLALLKVVAWKDKYPERSRDAEDLFLLMDNYELSGIEDRLYGDEQGLLEQEGYDNNLAGIRLLGRDIASLCEAKTKTIVAGILSNENDRFRLAADIIRNRKLMQERHQELLTKLEKLRDGFSEAE